MFPLQVAELMAGECGWDAKKTAAMTAAAREYLAGYLPPAAAVAAEPRAAAAS